LVWVKLWSAREVETLLAVAAYMKLLGDVN
jgi:hypothetical protein